MHTGCFARFAPHRCRLRVREGRAQALEGAGLLLPDARVRNAEAPGDIRGRETLHERKAEDVTICVSERKERRAHECVTLAREQLDQRPRLVGRQVGVRRKRRFLSPAPNDIGDHVVCDPVHERAQPGRILETMLPERGDGARHRLLSHVLSHVLVTEHAEGDETHTVAQRVDLDWIEVVG